MTYYRALQCHSHTSWNQQTLWTDNCPAGFMGASYLLRWQASATWLGPQSYKH